MSYITLCKSSSELMWIYQIDLNKLQLILNYKQTIVFGCNYHLWLKLR